MGEILWWGRPWAAKITAGCWADCKEPCGRAELRHRRLFDQDYLHFYAGALGDERSDAQTELLWRLLERRPGMEILDLACRDATDRGVAVEYVRPGDMRTLPWTGHFDRVISWFTAFGYFNDASNRQVLAEAVRALKPGGRLALEVQHRDWIVSALQPAMVMERDGDLLVDATGSSR